MFPYLLKVGNFELRIYSLMLMLAVLIAIIFITKRAIKLGMNKNKIENGIIYCFFASIAGARLYYVIFNWSYFSAYPAEIFAVWRGGLAIHGGIVAGMIFGYFYCKKNKLNIFKIFDITAPFIILGQGMGRFGNFANGEAHGVPTVVPADIIFRFKPVFNKFWNAVLTSNNVANKPEQLTGFYHKIKEAPQHVTFEGVTYTIKEHVPWGFSFPAKYKPQAYMEFGSMPVHPTFFYEMILNFITALILFYIWKKDENIGSGKLFALYLIAYGCIRAFVTFFRADDLMFGFLRAPHIASIFLIIAGIIWHKLAKRYA